MKTNFMLSLICSAYEMDDTDSDFAKKRRMSWAALIKSVYEVDPLMCPTCGGRTPPSGISFIKKHQRTIREKILRHFGKVKETVLLPQGRLLAYGSAVMDKQRSK